MILSDAALYNRTTVGVLTLLIFVFGLQAYIGLPREASPDVPVPVIIVSTPYEGVAPADIETAVTLKIEKELAGLKGVKQMTSTSAEGLSTIAIEFLPDVLVDDAMQYVRDRVDRARRDVPDTAEETTITEVSFADFPIMMINLSGSLPPLQLKELADALEEELEAIPGVLSVEILGAPEREIRIETDQDRLAAYDLTLSEILGLVPAENVNISAGGLATPGVRFNVRVPAEFVDPGDVDGLMLAIRDGRPIYLTDVAQIRDTYKDRTQFSRLNGQDTVTLTVQKRVGANILEIAGRVRAVLAEFERLAPPGISVAVTLDQSQDVEAMVRDLENSLLSGMLLVVVVLVLVMGWRPALVVTTAIPAAMLLSFIVIDLLGYTLNMIVLFSLIMAVGMLVDNAIVIVENIDRHYALGGQRLQAALIGTREVAWPVITSTFTTVAAFAPMVFWPGIMGGFMKYLPITLIIVLLSSLLIALVITPVLSALLARAPRRRTGQEPLLLRTYRRVLSGVLGYRMTTILTVLLVLVAIAMLYTKRDYGVELFPEFDPRRGSISVRTPQGTNVAEVDALVREIERRLEPFAADLVNVVANVGFSGGGADFGSTSGEHLANITLIFHEYEHRPRPSAEALAEIRTALADLSGAEIRVEKEEEGPPTGAAVTVRISGRDFALLEELSETARTRIDNVPGLVNLRSDHEKARPELAFRVDRQRAMLLGVNTAIVGNFLKTAVFGSEVGKYRQFNDEYDITIRLPEAQRTQIDDLFRLRVPNLRGASIPLSSLGEFEYTGGFGTIRRIDQRRVISLLGDAEGRLSTDVLADVQQALEPFVASLPPGYRLDYAGEKEEQDKAAAFLSQAFLLAVFLILLILVAQFNTLIVPFIILMTVVLSLIGVFAGLLINHMPFGIIMTGVGVISLAGVVVNNAIVLLAYTRQLQAEGIALVAAAIQAGATRLRPVLLTAVTTILGLIPMAVGISFDFRELSWNLRSESSQWWASMAIAVIYGLAFATLLTLVVVPTLYVMLMRATHFLRRLSGGTPDAVHGPTSG
ncbi:MAG: efflux RND transporter permease subunit [Phycisphaerales bacterium]|nr:efflux RND transporter permease subunit [Phycisphaerales bacterium]